MNTIIKTVSGIVAGVSMVVAPSLIIAEEGRQDVNRVEDRSHLEMEIEHGVVSMEVHKSANHVSSSSNLEDNRGMSGNSGNTEGTDNSGPGSVDSINDADNSGPGSMNSGRDDDLLVDVDNSGHGSINSTNDADNSGPGSMNSGRDELSVNDNEIRGRDVREPGEDVRGDADENEIRGSADENELRGRDNREPGEDIRGNSDENEIRHQ